MDAGDPEKIKQLLGGLFESYVDRLIRSFAPSSEVLVNSYLNPVVFDSEKKPEACDGLLLWPSMAVLLECKTNMLTSRQRYAMSLKETTKAIDDQLAKFTDPGEANSGRARKGVGQLAYNLYRVLRGERVLHNGKPVDLLSVPKLYPAIVIYDEGMANHLELVSKPSQADEDAGEVDKSLVDEAIVFVADHEAAEAAEPGDGAFDLPAAAVAPEFPAILRVRSYSATATSCAFCLGCTNSGLRALRS